MLDKVFFLCIGDDISYFFFDLFEMVKGNMVLDGELLVIYNVKGDVYDVMVL